MDDKCEWNHEGMCVVTEDFPEMKDDPCRFNKDGFCTAKSEDLISICPDCGELDCDGGCVDMEERIMVPRK